MTVRLFHIYYIIFLKKKHIIVDKPPLVEFKVCFNRCTQAEITAGVKVLNDSFGYIQLCLRWN